MLANKSQIFLFAVDTVISLNSYSHSRRMRRASSFQHVVKEVISCPPPGLLARYIYILLMNMNCIKYNSFCVDWVMHAARTYVSFLNYELVLVVFLCLLQVVWLGYSSAIRKRGILCHLACKWRNKLGSAVCVMTEYVT